ncbi:sensor histidine kinase [Muriicola soli]|uniref:histidine kinase n=1 Tax=Muriicola soli TaxID=2507538 RepID=A0A411EAE9_9FLAO|nr:sensor histidine kinase [Muriicola soli]QBA64494.1 histidine kinase [Muriicola soli]
MRTLCIRVVFSVLFTLISGYHGTSQIIDFSRENSYKQIFRQTDNFGFSYLDTLELGYKNAPTDSLRLTILNDLAYYWHTRDLQKAYEFTRMGLKEAKAKELKTWVGRFRVTYGAVLLRDEKLDSARIVLGQAMEVLNQKEYPFLYTQLGYVYEREGNLSAAAEYALRSLRLGEKFNDLHAQAQAYSDLSNLFWKQEKYQKGLEQGLLALSLFEAYGMNDLDYDFALYVVGNQYLALNDPENALKYYSHAISIGERYGFYNNLSDIYISLADLHGSSFRYADAETAALNAIQYSERLNNNFMLMRSWLSLGKLQNLQGKFLSAITSLQTSIDIATEDFGDAFFLSEAYQNLGKAYAGSHNYKDAYHAFEMYDQLQKEVFTEESAERMSQIQTELEVAEKDSTIQLQDTQIKKQRIIQTLGMIVIVLLFLYLLLIFKSVRRNRENNKLLQLQNEEKEFLLKEIHHRVKNNLEIVSSLLILQSEQISDTNVRSAMVKSQQRVHSMSMIHQKLYQGSDLSNIEMKDYFENLGSHIINSYGMEDRINLRFAMKPIAVDIDQAIPIGLIVNELLSNALKYAFPGNRKGEVTISLEQHESVLHLEVSDNGVGKMVSQEPEGTGFGTQLIKLLTTQLDGEMKLVVDKGTLVSFDFQRIKAA